MFRDASLSPGKPVVTNVFRWTRRIARHANSDRVYSVMQRRLEMILQAGLRRGISSYVLGTWGCGAFHNAPRNVAHLIRQGIEKTRKAVRQIVVAIRGEADSENVAAFLNEFREYLDKRVCLNELDDFPIPEILSTAGSSGYKK